MKKLLIITLMLITAMSFAEYSVGEIVQPGIAPDTLIIKNFDIDNLGFGSTINPTSKVSVKGSGGPDGYGYIWTDSDEAGGPVYNWVEINTIGTYMALTDDGVYNGVNLGFTFNYYGVDYTTINIGANGVASFTSTGITISWLNATIPTATAPNALLCPFWDDLSPPIGGKVYYYADGANNRFIIEWDGVPRYGTSETQTFQVIIYETGNIVFQYADMTGTLTSATIGIENTDGSDGNLVVFNAAYVKNNLAIEFSAASGTAPGVPANVVTSVSGSNLVIDWDAVTGATSYDVYSSDDPYGSFSLSNNTVTNQYTVATSVAKKFYYIVAKN